MDICNDIVYFREENLNNFEEMSDSLDSRSFFVKVPYEPREKNDWNIFAYRLIDKSRYATDYADDIYKTLLETELKREYIYFNSQQFVHRPMLLNVIKFVADKHKLLRTTMHLAIYYLDRFLDVMVLPDNLLNLVVIVCIIIASKIEENDPQVPKFSKLNKLVGDVFTKTEMIQTEFRVLTTLNFNLIRPTVATFAEYFAKNIITLADYHIYINNWHNGTLNMEHYKQLHRKEYAPLYYDYTEMLNTATALLFNIVDITVNYMPFGNDAPSLLASACLAATRRLLCITPIWSPFIESLTGYIMEKVIPYEKTVILMHDLYGNDLPPNSYTLGVSLDDGTDVVLSTDFQSFEKESLCEAPEDNNTEVEDALEYFDDYPLPSKRRCLQ